MDDNYQTYLNRVARMTLLEAYRTQIQHIQESAKFQPLPTGARQAVPFPGYTVITPPQEEDSENTEFYKYLQNYQEQLLKLPVNSSDIIIPVPNTSFHMTLADLIWDNAYKDACDKNPQFDEQLRSLFTEIFQQYRRIASPTQPIRWQIQGLTVMPRAIGVCLVPQDKYSYEQILSFRRTIYQNSNLLPLGIEQHYHLTAHITLGYFGEISSNIDRDNLASTLDNFNQQWIENAPLFTVHRAELRKFDDMTRYYREPDWPILDFR